MLVHEYFLMLDSKLMNGCLNEKISSKPFVSKYVNRALSFEWRIEVSMLKYTALFSKAKYAIGKYR